jgi:phosphoadenosine phosphosulfate reductase
MEDGAGMIDLSPLGQHENVALSFSGGKDSLACVYLLRDHRDRITIYHMDTGDLLPEVREIVAHVKGFWPRFVHIQGDVLSWIAKYGLPTDLMPHTSHPLGRAAGASKVPLVPRYDCCFLNLMMPTYQRIKADGNTLLIRGTKSCDMKRLPAASGDSPDGVELWLPIQSWSHAQVFDYLCSVQAPISRIYSHVTNSPECARCSAWWAEDRASYLRKYHPGLFSDYATRLRQVADEVAIPLQNLKHELDACEGAA